MRRTTWRVIGLILAGSLFWLGCGKNSDNETATTPSGTAADDPAGDDSPVVVNAPDIEAAIKASFPLMILPPSLRLADEEGGDGGGCDAYSNEMETFNCGYGSTFQRTFAFDPASIYFSSFIVSMITEMINSSEETLTFGEATDLTLPYFKDGEEEAITAAVDKTFEIIEDGEWLVRTDPDRDDEKMYLKITSLKGGFTDKILVADIVVGIYDSQEAANPGIFFKLLFLGDVTEGLVVKMAMFGYEAEGKTAPEGEIVVSSFETDEIPEGYKSGSAIVLDLAVDEENMIHYRAGAGDENGYYSFIMAGTLEKLLLRKRALNVSDFDQSSTLAEQFWVISFDESSGTFTDLGIDDSTDAYRSVSDAGNFDFSTTESVGFGDSLSSVLTDKFSAISLDSAVIDYVVGSRMYNPANATDIPHKMSTLATGW